MTKRRIATEPRRFWQPWELEQLRLQYPHMQTKVIAAMLDRRVTTLYAMADQLGLAKTPEYLASPASGRTCGRQGIGSRFVKGQPSWNKGLHYQAGGRCKETQFKKGQMPHTWQPIGTERVNADGYRDRKVTDTGYPPRDWVGIHRLMWMEAYGPIRRGYSIVFRNGDKADIRLDNFECLSRADLMKRNTVHNLPKPLAQLVQLRGALMRQINRREYGKQDRGLAGSPVRNAGRAAGHGKADGDRAGKGRGRGRKGDRG